MTQPVSGTVTINSGASVAATNITGYALDASVTPLLAQTNFNNFRTNWETRVPAIETDADAIRVAAEIMDDWDETDRAKVNLIAGSAGIQGGQGNTTTNTTRVVIASDQPGVPVTGTFFQATQPVSALENGSKTRGWIMGAR